MPDITAKINKLLTMAENTSFAEEAEAFFQKAQELMTENAITEAMLEAARTPEERTRVVLEQGIEIPGPYGRHKVSLYHAVAAANDVEFYYTSEGGGRYFANLAGTPSDIANVKALATSLLLHLQRDLVKVKGSYSGPWGNDTKAYRIHFINGFTDAIRSRLTQAKQKAERTASEKVAAEEATSGEEASRSVGLALLDKKRFVQEKTDELLAEKNIRLRSVRRSLPGAGYGGRSAGHASGSRADLGGSRIGGGAGQIGSGR